MTVLGRAGILVSARPMRNVPLAVTSLRYDCTLPIVLSIASDFEQFFLGGSVRLSRLVLIFRGRCLRHLPVAWRLARRVLTRICGRLGVCACVLGVPAHS